MVSIDAMGCQKNVAETIINAKSDYVLALKDNHKGLCENVRLWLDTENAAGRLPLQETTDKDHGRIEIRRYSLSTQIDWLEQKPEWKGLVAVGRVESMRSMVAKPRWRRAIICVRSSIWSGLPRARSSALEYRKPAALGLGCAVRRR